MKLLVLAAGLMVVCSQAAGAVPCSACHAQNATEFTGTAHGIGFASKFPDAGCVSCHGDASGHMTNPGAGTIQTFPGLGAEAAKLQGEVCGSCHGKAQKPHIDAHSSAGVACASCHQVHSSQTPASKTEEEHLSWFRAVDPPDVSSLRHIAGVTDCTGCHQDTAAEFSFNERHRLGEGGVTCTDCHDPHDPVANLGLGGFGDSVCANCHAEVTGPFVFEHGASRVEGCVACHSPHGSPNRHMLAQQDVGALCYSCHAEVPQFHTGFSPAAPARFNEKTVCTNCHVAIHGSNHDKALLR